MPLFGQSAVALGSCQVSTARGNAPRPRPQRDTRGDSKREQLLPLPDHKRARDAAAFGNCRVPLLLPPDLPGDHTRVDTPVPIPNTAVKRAGPMIVPIARK